MRRLRGVVRTGALAGVLALLTGCPEVSAPTEFILGSSGDAGQVSDAASIQVLSPVSNLSISGGTQVEVNWRAVATTRTAVIDVFVDVDQNPNNGNETLVFDNLDLATNMVLIDTTDFVAGDYFVGASVEEVGVTVAFDYAPGRVTINQRPQFFFTSPRDNFAYDRTEFTNPRFDVAWQVLDPDSIVNIQIFLDPDSSPNGNEVLLRESNSQTGDSFAFDLPTASFEAGTYRILALVSDGVDTFAFYAPGSILLRSRLASIIDLRDLDLPTSPVAGAVFEGFNPRDNAGSFLASARDIDRDGFADFLINSQFGKPNYQSNLLRTGVGEAYLIYGRADRFSGKISLNSVGTTFRGDIYVGPPEVEDPIRPSRGITSFAVLSDWDGDGFREFAFGVPFVDSLSLGAALLGTDPTRVAPLDPSGYFRTGVAVIASSSSLRPDLGFPGRNVFGLAEFGTLAHGPLLIPPPCPEGFYGPKAPTLPGGSTYYHRHLVGVGGAPNAGGVRLGCRFSSNEFGDQFGETVSAYDFDSIIISAPNRDPSVSTFAQLVDGAPVPGAGVVSTYFVSANTGFFPWTGIGSPPANADLNYLGVPEGHSTTLPHWGPYHYIMDDMRLFLAQAAGSSQVFLDGAPGYYVDPDDSANPCEIVIDADICIPDRTTRIWSPIEGARIGNAKGLADFNADGLADIVVGSPLSNNGAGACYIILGRLRNLMMTGELNLEELGLPLNSSDPGRRRIFDGIRVRGGPGDRLGQSQDSAGDFNNDGISDIIIGSPLVNDRRGGAAIFFGSREVINLTEEEIPFDELPARGLGVIFAGEDPGDLTGSRVAGVGDIDGDGIDDIMIAAPDRSVQVDYDLDGTLEVDRTDCGVVYLVYGSPNLRGTINLSLIGTEQLPGAVFVGRNSGDHLGAGLGEQGDRSIGIAGAGDVDGDGRGDLLLGAVSATPRGGRVAAGEAYLIYGTGD